MKKILYCFLCIWLFAACSAPGQKTGGNSMNSFGVPVAYGLNQALSFPNFKVMLLAIDKSSTPGTSKTKVIYRFQVVSDQNISQDIRIESGQLPPQPATFTLGDESYQLSIYSLPNGDRLKPEHLAIFKK